MRATNEEYIAVLERHFAFESERETIVNNDDKSIAGTRVGDIEQREAMQQVSSGGATQWQRSILPGVSCGKHAHLEKNALDDTGATFEEHSSDLCGGVSEAWQDSATGLSRVRRSDGAETPSRLQRAFNSGVDVPEMSSKTPQGELKRDNTAEATAYPTNEIFQVGTMARKPQQTNFAKIKRALDRDYLPFDRAIRKILTKTRDDVVEWAERLLKDSSANSGAIASFSVDSGSQLADQIGKLLLHYWRRGRDIGFKELPTKVRRGEKLKALKTFGLNAGGVKVYNAEVLPEWYGIKTYQTGFSPVEALQAFDIRKWLIKAVIDEGLQKDTRWELMTHLSGGRTVIETIKNIRQLFEPYIGDPSKIAPSGRSGAPEDVLQAYRLEGIVRNESAWALNQGRLAIADVAGDYVQGLEYSAVLDERTTEICNFAGGEDGEPIRVRADSPEAARLTPPNHFGGCRSIWIYLTTDDAPIKFSTQAQIDKAIRLIQKDFK